MEWDQTYGGAIGDSARSVVRTSDGGYALAGRTWSFGIESDCWLVKTDSAGNMEWNQPYGGACGESEAVAIQTNDGGYALTGPTVSFPYEITNLLLIKIASPDQSRISASVDIDPNKLNLKSNGPWVTAYVTLPDDYSVNDIAASTLSLNFVPIDWYETVDEVLICKFNREMIKINAYILIEDFESGDKFYESTLKLRGSLLDGTVIEGTDTITIIMQ
jgi:hypothetical protein